ncbi:allophanate hydrolase [Arboricoccus pini]|uniref:Allophanate hydrolase n=1 Tax=Arboricoccus pini TaxID=1963835 RepID=A0A212R6P5_9PROT|nr:allophanate hydrolase [Arboricoccus pini]SNB67834.1 allophanate hydrolase [Arboricoccus pini]
MMVRAFPTIGALHEAYARDSDPTLVIAELYRRMAVLDDPGIFITLRSEAEILSEIKALGPFDPKSRPLWGVPFAVKDNIDVVGLPTTAGCPDFAYKAAVDAFAVQRLRAAGAIPIGKTNLDQFATGLVGVRTPYPVPRNAIDAAYVPGGSSSGSAVAVARGLVTFALGTDTAGSGRVPAGLNNIVGLKPSLGSVSTRGVVPACRTLDTISVFASTVGDADTVFRVMQGYDPMDGFCRDLPVGGMPSRLPPRLRVGVPDASSRVFGGDALAEAAFDAAMGDLQALSEVEIVPVDMQPLFDVAALLYAGPWVAERYQAIRDVMETRPDILHPTTRRIIEGAKAYSAADAFAGQYKLAALRRAAQSILARIDLLVVPTYPRPRKLEELEVDPIGPNSELGTYTNFVNLLDLAALAVPSRFRADGFPSGVTLIAGRGQDGLLASLGMRLHAAAGVMLGASTTPVPEAPVGQATAVGDEIEVVVVGAHLSGMPLNGELVRRGARFLRATKTKPYYRLLALPGGPPARPGLVRVADRRGAAIEVEVWALPAAGFGAFVADIPAPLGIGTTYLDDGSTPKGFILEPAGQDGALDISSYGGWRAYIAAL